MSSPSFGLLCLVSFFAAPCQEAPKGQEEKKIKVTIFVILATEEGNHVDKELKWLAQEVQKLNPNFKSFKVKHFEVKSLAKDEKASFNLVDKKTALVVVKHGADVENRVCLAVTAPDQGEIVYRCACGKFLPIITRYQTAANERLILAIRVQPCNGK